MLGSNFYFQLIRKYITIFGVLFDKIIIARTDTNGNVIESMKVPLTYAPKDKMLTRLIQDPAIQKLAAITLPRISFELVGVTYDSDRKLNKIGRVVVRGDDANHMKMQYNPVAYNFNFRLYVYAKNSEDMTKIVEQIFPYFTPDYTVTAHLIPEMNITMDIPIILHNVSIEDKYEGDFITRRALIWILDFTLKGYLYGPIMDKPIIKWINTTWYVGGPDEVNDPIGVLTVNPGLTANGDPTSNSALTIDVNQIWFDDDWGVISTIDEGILTSEDLPDEE